MKKNNRLSFSAVSIENKNEQKSEQKPPEKKKQAKSSTYQYSKFGKRRPPKGRPFHSGDKSRNSNENKIPPLEKGAIRIVPLGGVEEIGKNMTAIETDDDIIVIDAGMYFSNEETPGVDYVIPNTTYLEERKDKIRALFITHAHLDHIGGVPVVLSRIGNPPVYSRNLSILMIKKRQAEFPHLPPLKAEIVEKDETIMCGKTKVRFFGVTHTIPDSMGVIIETKNGWIVTPGDYKLDQIDGVVSAEEEKEYSIFDKEKVLLLMTDSTNVENEGYSLPETKVHQGLENLIKKINGRIIIAAFASHITRLTHVVKVAEGLGKKIAIDGRSMKTNIDVAIEAGYFKPKKGTIIPVEEAGSYPPNKVVILMTGSQGEEFAALSRAANKSHTKFSIKKGDTIILSASIVPGNERAVEKIKDNLSRQGVRIISYRTAGEDFVHATGHGNKEDIKWLHKKTHPKFFIPIHGNHYRLELHKELAMEVGTPEENIVVPDNGSIIEISPDGEKMTLRKEKAPSAPMMVDGLAISDVQDVVIRDRQMLAQDGMFVIIALMDQKTGKLKKSPDLISRGFVYLKENQELLRQVRIIIKKSIEDISQKMNPIDFDSIKNNLGETISKFLYQKTAKRPLVIPVVLGV
ncbi:ribonuclease J [Patescibacteria group bacterium]|nr:ribonuclease J [Patescibacteria group bacterium]MBU1727806.1 ribonuclease J [Patescibacteria group bacterium]